MKIDLGVALLVFIIGLLVSYLTTFLIGVSIGGEAFVGVTILFLSAIIAGKEKDDQSS